MLLALLLACGGPPTIEPGPTPPDGVFEGLVWQSEGFANRRIVWKDGVITENAPTEASAGERRLTPGLVDAHAHPMGLGAQLVQLDLIGAATLSETLGRVKAHPVQDGWVLGRGWDQNDWTDHDGFPTAADLDGVTTAPAMLRRIDGHAAWVNTAALKAAGITRDTPDPDGGRILKDASGAPTGILVDNAMDLVSPPEPSNEELERRIRASLQKIADVGLTGVHDTGASDATIALYEKLDEAGEMPVRVVVYTYPESKSHARLLESGPWSGDRFDVVGVKLSADGALGSRGAWLTAPYSDEPGHHGLQMLDDAYVQKTATDLLAKDAQLAVHAIGDRAIHQVLNAYEAARSAHPDKKGVPLRVEHVQIVRPDDIPRFAALKVVASMQPTHCTSDMPWAPERLGEERTGWAYRWRDLLDAKAVMAFGSDFPVEHPDVALGLWSAVRRQSLDGTPDPGWSVDQAVSIEEAIQLFSQGSAHAAGMEWKGLEVGAPADLVVWKARDDQPWEPLETWVAGERVDSRRFPPPR